MRIVCTVNDSDRKFTQCFLTPEILNAQKGNDNIRISQNSQSNEGWKPNTSSKGNENIAGFKQTYVQRVYIKFHRSKTRQGTSENDLWDCELVQAKDSV